MPEILPGGEWCARGRDDDDAGGNIQRYGGMLRASRADHGEMYTMIEIGTARAEPSLATGVVGVQNVMKSLAMLEGATEAVSVAGHFEERLSYRVLSAERGGICRLLKTCGDRVKAGEGLVSLHGIWGDEIETIAAPVDGLLLAYPIRGNQAAASGDKVAYLAYDRRRQSYFRRSQALRTAMKDVSWV